MFEWVWNSSKQAICSEFFGECALSCLPLEIPYTVSLGPFEFSRTLSFKCEAVKSLQVELLAGDPSFAEIILSYGNTNTRLQWPFLGTNWNPAQRTYIKLLTHDQVSFRQTCTLVVLSTSPGKLLLCKESTAIAAYIVLGAPTGTLCFRSPRSSRRAELYVVWSLRPSWAPSDLLASWHQQDFYVEEYVSLGGQIARMIQVWMLSQFRHVLFGPFRNVSLPDDHLQGLGGSGFVAVQLSKNTSHNSCRLHGPSDTYNLFHAWFSW